MQEPKVTTLTCGHCGGANSRSLPYDLTTIEVCDVCNRLLKPIDMLLWCPECGERHIDDPPMDINITTHTLASFVGWFGAPACNSLEVLNFYQDINYERSFMP